MICYPEIAAFSDNSLDHKTIINNIIQVINYYHSKYSSLKFIWFIIFKFWSFFNQRQISQNFENFLHFNVNTFFKWVPTSKSQVTYDLDTDLDTDTTTHKIIGVVGSPSTSLYLPQIYIRIAGYRTRHITGIKMLWDAPYSRQKRVSYAFLNERMGKVVSL